MAGGTGNRALFTKQLHLTRLGLAIEILVKQPDTLNAAGRLVESFPVRQRATDRMMARPHRRRIGINRRRRTAVRCGIGQAGQKSQPNQQRQMYFFPLHQFSIDRRCEPAGDQSGFRQIDRSTPVGKLAVYADRPAKSDQGQWPIATNHLPPGCQIPAHQD